MLQAGDLAPAFRARPVFGRVVDIPGDLATGPLVLCFVRHLGSPFARATIAALHEHFAELDRAGVSVVVIAAGSLEVARDFVPRHHVLFRLVVDSDGTLAELYQVGRDRWLGGTARHLLTGGLVDLPSALAFGQGRVEGDPLRLGAELVIGRDGQLAHVHHGVGITDPADLDALVACALSL